MLILTRKLGERIFIGPDIIITLVEIDRGRVRIGVQAPQAVQILREELTTELTTEGKNKRTLIAETQR